MSCIINCHTHIFTLNHVPKHFIPGQQLLASSREGRYRLAGLLHRLKPRSNDDSLDRLASFLINGNFSSQEEVFERLCLFYPADTRFAVHSMDFEYMGAGKCPRTYPEQLAEMAALRRKFPQRIYPFFCADPRRPDVYELFRHYMKEGFTGIKLYPPMGFFPFDERLYPLYEYAQQHELPVMTHCSASGPVYGRNIPPKEERIHPRTQTPLVYKQKKNFGDYYTDPANYRYVLEDFPRLKICFAHFGGDTQCMRYYKSNDPEEIRDNWFVKILELLRVHPNTYADISYASADLDLLALFNALLQDPAVGSRILFGSDFYMANIERNERWFSMNVRMGLGEEHYMQMAHTNAVRYLNINEE